MYGICTNSAQTTTTVSEESHMIRMTQIATTALLPAVLWCGHAKADLVAVLDVSTDTGFSQSLSVQGTASSATTITWAEQLVGENFLVAITMMGQLDGPSLGTVVQATNSSDAPMQMSIGFTMPMNAMAGGSVYWMGSLAASLNGTDVLLDTVLNTAIWSASIGDDLVGTLFEAPFQLAVDGTGSVTATDTGAGQLDWFGGDTLSVQFAFTLDSGASVMFNGGFGVIPGPSPLALLGICPFIGRRRRR